MSSQLSEQGINFPQVDYAIGLDTKDLSKFALRFKEIRDSWDKDYHTRMCIPFSGVFFRFGKADHKSPLSPMSARDKNSELNVVIDFVVYNPIEFTENEKELYFKPWNFLATTMINEFSGKVHFAKNTPSILALGKKEHKKGLETLRKARSFYAPSDLFSNKFSRDLLQ